MNPNNEDEIYAIFALFYEDVKDPFCSRCCYEYQTQGRPNKRQICNKYREKMLEYLKTQGIEKA